MGAGRRWDFPRVNNFPVSGVSLSETPSPVIIRPRSSFFLHKHPCPGHLSLTPSQHHNTVAWYSCTVRYLILSSCWSSLFICYSEQLGRSVPLPPVSPLLPHTFGYRQPDILSAGSAYNLSRHISLGEPNQIYCQGKAVPDTTNTSSNILSPLPFLKGILWLNLSMFFRPCLLMEVESGERNILTAR